jgi:uncharacterized repeat protein (TIGR04138 family)
MSKPKASAEKMAADFARAVRADGRYPVEAYEFLQRGLALAALRQHGDAPLEGRGPRHVTGQQLCHALRDLARELWGPLASPVLRRWNVHRTRDLGEMVFLLIRIGLFGKRPEDCIEDFDDVFDLHASLSEYCVPFEHFDAARGQPLVRPDP